MMALARGGGGWGCIKRSLKYKVSSLLKLLNSWMENPLLTFNLTSNKLVHYFI